MMPSSSIVLTMARGSDVARAMSKARVNNASACARLFASNCRAPSCRNALQSSDTFGDVCPGKLRPNVMASKMKTLILLILLLAARRAHVRLDDAVPSFSSRSDRALERGHPNADIAFLWSDTWNCNDRFRGRRERLVL